MFEAGVEVCFGREQHNVLEVCVVDVSVNSEQSFEDFYKNKFTNPRLQPEQEMV